MDGCPCRDGSKSGWLGVRFIAIFQGGYFFLTGIWPLISIDTFQMVTGPKTDLWLVKTVGSLVTVAGLVIFIAAIRDNVTFEIFLFAVGWAGALTAVDVNYSLRGVISRIYLLDAAVEVAIIILWLRGWASGD
jgi:hypothetical protein